MPLGSTSRKRLATAHSDLQRLFEEVADGVDRGECSGVRDITILCGFRGELDQNRAFDQGHSKLRWPASAHNKTPALAVDAAPYPLDWLDVLAFDRLQAYVRRVAVRLGISLRDRISWDPPHYELRVTRASEAPTVRLSPRG